MVVPRLLPHAMILCVTPLATANAEAFATVTEHPPRVYPGLSLPQTSAAAPPPPMIPRGLLQTKEPLDIFVTKVEMLYWYISTYNSVSKMVFMLFFVNKEES